MSHVALIKGGKETGRFFLIPDSMDDLAKSGAFIHDMVDASGKNDVVAASNRFARDWPSLLGLADLSVGGFPLSSLVHLQFRFRLTFLFLLLEFARRAVAQGGPDAVVLSGMPFEERRTLRLAFGALGVRVEEGTPAGSGGFHGFSFRLGSRFRRISEVTLPRYAGYLRRMCRMELAATPREDPRILVADSFCMTPEAVRYLKSRGTLLHVMDTDRGLKKILLKAGLPFRSVVLKGVPPGDWPDPARTRFPAEAVWKFSYAGIPFFPLIERDIRWAVWNIAPRLFSYGSLPGEGLRRIILREQNGPEGKMLVWLAKQAGIPTVMLQHGLMGGEYGYLPMDADLFFAWGEDGCRWLVEKGVEEEKVKVFGCPRFDRYGHTAVKDEGGKFQKRLLILLESTEYSGEDTPLDNYRMLRLVHEALEPLVDWRVAIRFHPAQTGEEREAFRRFVRLYGSRMQIARDIVLGRSLEKADVVVTEASTAGMEALLLGKLLLVVRRRGIAGNPYAWTDVLPRADSPERIREYLSAWGNHATARQEARERGERFLAGYLHREEEPASVRFWKYCLS